MKKKISSGISENHEEIIWKTFFKHPTWPSQKEKH